MTSEDREALWRLNYPDPVNEMILGQMRAGAIGFLCGIPVIFGVVLWDLWQDHSGARAWVFGFFIFAAIVWTAASVMLIHTMVISAQETKRRKQRPV